MSQGLVGKAAVLVASEFLLLRILVLVLLLLLILLILGRSRADAARRQGVSQDKAR